MKDPFKNCDDCDGGDLCDTCPDDEKVCPQFQGEFTQFVCDDDDGSDACKLAGHCRYNANNPSACPHYQKGLL